MSLKELKWTNDTTQTLECKPVKNYDPHKKYKKVGECKRCGRCCDLHCPRLKWTTIKDIKKGEQFETGKDKGYIYATCKIFDAPVMEGACTPEQRKGFPFDPWQTPPNCGFKWVEAES